MLSPWLHGCTLIVLSLSIATGATAAESPSHPCAPIGDSTARLACYDAAFPRPADGRSGAVADSRPADGRSGVVADPRPTDGRPGAAAEEAERAAALREFGLTKEQLRKREPERMREITPDRIEAKVAGIDRRSTGERVITLDNGQVWLLTEVTSKGRLRPGDPVVIRDAALSSFMLITPGRASLRARRIK